MPERLSRRLDTTSSALLPIGETMWHVTDLVLFTAPDAQSTSSCVMGDRHVWEPPIWGPGEPHEAPYATELTDAVEGCGYRIGAPFR